MSLLLSSHPGDLIWWSENASGYAFALEDAYELLAAGREDLSVLVIEKSPNADLLCAAAAAHSPSSWRLAAARSPRTRVGVLAGMCADPDPEVREIAKDRLRYRLGVSREDLETILPQVAYALTCSSREAADLADASAAHARSGDSHSLAAGAVLAACLMREEPLADSSWSHLIDTAASLLRHTSYATPVALLKEVTRSSHCSVEDLARLLSCSTHRAQVDHLVQALLSHGVVPRHKAFPQLEMLRPDWFVNGPVHLGDTPESLAVELYREGGLLVPLAAASGALPVHLADACVLDYLGAARSGLSRTLAVALAAEAVLMTGPLSHGVVVEVLDAARDGHDDLAAAVAQVPSLSVESQHAIVDLVESSRGFETAALVLAGNRGVSESVVLRLLDWARTPDTRRHSPLDWMELSVLLNGSLSAELRLGMSARCVSARQGSSVAEAAAPLLEPIFDGQAERWVEFTHLLPEWEGSLGELAEALVLV